MATLTIPYAYRFHPGGVEAASARAIAGFECAVVTRCNRGMTIEVVGWPVELAEVVG